MLYYLQLPWIIIAYQRPPEVYQFINSTWKNQPITDFLMLPHPLLLPHSPLQTSLLCSPFAGKSSSATPNVSLKRHSFLSMPMPSARATGVHLTVTNQWTVVMCRLGLEAQSWPWKAEPSPSQVHGLRGPWAQASDFESPSHCYGTILSFSLI